MKKEVKFKRREIVRLDGYRIIHSIHKNQKDDPNYELFVAEDEQKGHIGFLIRIEVPTKKTIKIVSFFSMSFEKLSEFATECGVSPSYLRFRYSIDKEYHNPGSTYLTGIKILKQLKFQETRARGVSPWKSQH